MSSHIQQWHLSMHITVTLMQYENCMLVANIQVNETPFQNI